MLLVIKKLFTFTFQIAQSGCEQPLLRLLFEEMVKFTPHLHRSWLRVNDAVASAPKEEGRRFEAVDNVQWEDERCNELESSNTCDRCDLPVK